MSIAKKEIAIAGRRPPARSKYELAFLPAALEIVETPPTPYVHLITTTIILLFCVTVGWACYGTIDIVATASGKIIPSGRTKIVQPFETGVVRAIHVADGQEVKAGEALIELDPTMNDAETKHLKNDLVTAELAVDRLTAALSDSADPVAAFHPPEDATVGQVSAERRLLQHQVAEQKAKISALDSQQAEKAAELRTITATVNKLDTVLPILKQRVDIRQILFAHETGSKVNYLEIFQALVEAQQDLLVQKSRLQEAKAAVDAVVGTKAQAAAEYSRSLSTDLVEAQRKVAGLSDDLIKAEQRSKLQVLKSPVDGTVQQLSVHTIGGVVTPAQALLVIVPADSHLEIDAMISNRDIGFIHVGQDVEIKVDTFNFTRYGLIHGKVLSISQDAISRDQQQNNSNDGTSRSGSPTSEPRGQELVYAARISLDRTQMQIEERTVKLSPGMAITAEVKTGSRTVMSYLLSPLLRYQHDGLRER